jgi:hypothetical protein
MKAHGMSVKPIWAASVTALRDSLSPIDMTKAWLEACREAMDYKERALFKSSILAMDALCSEPCVKGLLYPSPIASFPNMKKRGLVDLPDQVLAALDAYIADRGFASNTYRALRTTVTHILTAGLDAGVLSADADLASILSKAAGLPVSARQRRDAANILRFLPA